LANVCQTNVAFTLAKAVAKMPATATADRLALAFLGNLAQIGMFLLVLCHPRKLRAVLPVSLAQEFLQQSLPVETQLNKKQTFYLSCRKGAQGDLKKDFLKIGKKYCHTFNKLGHLIGQGNVN
jgi:hypothetical protein